MLRQIEYLVCLDGGVLRNDTRATAWSIQQHAVEAVVHLVANIGTIYE